MLASVALACSVSDAAQAPAAAQRKAPLLLFHWWSSPSEMAALDALSGVAKARYPDLVEKRVAAPADRAAGLFTVLQNLARSGKSPDVVTMTTGYSMKPFVDAGLLARLDDLWIAERLEKVIAPGLQAVNQFDGHYYAAPVGVHRTNLVWYNKAVLDRHGIDPASLTNLESFLDAAERLRAAGVSTPIQMAATWTTVQTFGDLLAGQGLAVYRDWVNGKLRSASDPRLLAALEGLKRYASFANRDHASLEWPAASRRLAQGQSAFFWTGDWVHAELRAAGLVYGKDYGAIVAPGTNGLYGASVDALVKPLTMGQAENASRWLRIAASREGQDAFNAAKGSIPLRRDANVARYDSYQRWAIASFRTSRPYPIATAALPVPYANRLSGVLAAFLVDGDVRRAAAALAAAANDAAFTRVWLPE